MFDFWSFVQPGTDFGRVFDLRMSFDRLLDPIQCFGFVFNLKRSFGIVLPAWERFCSLGLLKQIWGVSVLGEILEFARPVKRFSGEFEVGKISVLCLVFERVWSCVWLCHVFSLRYCIACSGWREQRGEDSFVFPTNGFHVSLSPHLPFSLVSVFSCSF